LNGPGQVLCNVTGCGAWSPPLGSRREGERWLRRHLKKRHGIERERFAMPSVIVDPASPLAEQARDERNWTAA
jgi:hypothetical protein